MTNRFVKSFLPQKFPIRACFITDKLKNWNMYLCLINIAPESHWTFKEVCIYEHVDYKTDKNVTNVYLLSEPLVEFFI